MLKLILRFTFFFFVTLSIYSCNEEEVPLTAYGDVFIKSVKRGDTIVYGTIYYVYSWDKMMKVTVHRDVESSEITLDSTEYRFTFSHVTDSSEFKTTKPLKGKFIFNVVFDKGDQYEASDFLDSTALIPSLVKEFYFDQEDGRLIIDWEANILADKYIVILEQEDKEIAFQSELLNSDHTYLYLTLKSPGWEYNKQPQGGEKYKVYIKAYQFEPEASYFDLQSISETEAGLVEWTIKNN